MKLSEYRALVDGALAGFLPELPAFSAKLREAMEYSLTAPGKRLRPSLLLFAADLAGAPRSISLPFACALEMIHAYSLIHDDLPCMDDDDLRRGRPTCHRVFGEAIALLAGDGLLSQAFETMAKASFDAETDGQKIACLDAIAYISACAGASGMVAGQTVDMDHGGLGETGLLYIQENKTSKLMMAAVVGGLKLGNAPSQMQADFERFAQMFGAAFQMTDDILDVTGDERFLGKPVGSDGRQEKLTAVSLWGLEGAAKRARECVDAAKDAIGDYEGAVELALLAESLMGRTA